MNFWNLVRELLYSREWVVIPGLGAFLYQRLPARLEGDLLVSPYKRIIFRRAIRHDDGELTQYLAQVSGLDPEQIKGMTSMEVGRIEKELQEHSSARIPLFGLLIQDKLGNLSLLPEAGDRLDRPEELPLLAFVIQQKEVSALQKNFKKASWAAAAVLIGMLLLAPFLWTSPDQPLGDEAGMGPVKESTEVRGAPEPMEDQPEPMEDQPEKLKVETEPSKDEVEETTEKTEQKNVLDQGVKTSLRFNIVAGSFSSESRAKQYLRTELKRYTHAKVEQAPNGNYRVIVHTFASESETRAALEQVRRHVPDAWIQKQSI